MMLVREMPVLAAARIIGITDHAQEALGDLVFIEESRPISKNKRWVVMKDKKV